MRVMVLCVVVLAGCHLGHPGFQAGARTMAASHREKTRLDSVEAAFVLNYPNDPDLVTGHSSGGLYNPSTVEVDSDGGVIIGGGLGYEQDVRAGLLLGGSFHVAVDARHSDEHTEWVTTFETHVAFGSRFSSTRIGPVFRVYDRDEPNSWCAGLQLEIMLVDRATPMPGANSDPIGDYFNW